MYYDDFTVGQKFYLEPVTFTEEEIFEFARKYDPLPFHTDPEFAKNTIYGGIIASGFHTLCAVSRKWVELKVVSEEVIGGLGIDYLQWTAPVHPNDTLRGEAEILEKIPSSKGGRGILVYKVVVRNQEEQVVMIVQIKALVKSRE